MSWFVRGWEWGGNDTCPLWLMVESELSPSTHAFPDFWLWMWCEHLPERLQPLFPLVMNPCPLEWPL